MGFSCQGLASRCFCAIRGKTSIEQRCSPFYLHPAQPFHLSSFFEIVVRHI
jgi:hypothetical protein